MTIDVISDVVLPVVLHRSPPPWPRASLYASREPEIHPIVSWHPFQLNPDLPTRRHRPAGLSRCEVRQPATRRGNLRRVRAAGRSVASISLRAHRATAEHRDAHRLISWAQARGDPEDLVERLFRAYFLEGRGHRRTREVLIAVAGEAGLAADAAFAYLESEAGTDTIEAMDRRVRELGVTGVPFSYSGVGWACPVRRSRRRSSRRWLKR
jgi:predicted DsbA family dithiol-disulfide isomerase